MIGTGIMNFNEEPPVTPQELEGVPIEDLLRVAQEQYEQMQYQNCSLIYEKAYALEPKNEKVLAAYGCFLSNMKEIEKAKVILTEAIVLNPNENPKKYLYIAELYTGNDSATFYLKAIEILNNQIQQNNVFTNVYDIEDVNKDLAQAYSAMGELYMSDLCKAENAAELCLSFLLKSIEIDNQNLDAYYQLANYFLETDNEDKAKETILKIIEIYKQHNEKDDGFVDSYSSEFFLGVARVCIEVGYFNEAIVILDDLTQDDGKNLEYLYNNAYCNFMVKNYMTATEYINDLNELNLSGDPEIVAAKEELERELKKVDITTGNDYGEAEDEEWIDEEDDQNEDGMDVEMK